MKVKIEFGDNTIYTQEVDCIIEKMLSRMPKLVEEYGFGKASEEWETLADAVATYLIFYYDKEYDEEVAVYDLETDEPYFEF